MAGSGATKKVTFPNPASDEEYTSKSRKKSVDKSAKSWRVGKESAEKSTKSSKSGASAKSADSGKPAHSRSSSLSTSSKRPLAKNKNTLPSSRKSILIRWRHRNYHVGLAEFAAVSKFIKMQSSAGKVPSNVLLDSYQRETVEILVDFIQKNDRPASVSFFTVAELLKIANTLEIPGLRRQLEEYLVNESKRSVNALIQCLLILALTTVSRPIEEHIFSKAAANFLAIAKADNFQSLSFRVLSSLLCRCDLNVPSELAVADVTLLWLAGQRESPSYTPGILAFLRSHLLHPAEADAVLERARALCFTNENAAAVARALRASHGFRVCVGHSRGVRCASVPAHAAKSHWEDVAMPLSFPRESIFNKSERDKQKDARSLSCDNFCPVSLSSTGLACEKSSRVSIISSSKSTSSAASSKASVKAGVKKFGAKISGIKKSGSKQSSTGPKKMATRPAAKKNVKVVTSGKRGEKTKIK